MTTEAIARAIANGLKKHPGIDWADGYVDSTAGISDVVIDGRFDLLAVAKDVGKLIRGEG